MKNNFLKSIMVLFLCGLMLANVNVMFAEHPSEQHLDLFEGGAGASGSTYTCSSGGPGSTSCSVEVGAGGGSTGCNVSCSSGYYACCNSYVNKCQCRKDK